MVAIVLRLDSVTAFKIAALIEALPGRRRPLQPDDSIWVYQGRVIIPIDFQV
jgi:hypothetical protein